MPFLFGANERWGHIFVFTLGVYCCITKHPQILCLNQQTFHVITVLLEKSWNPNWTGLSLMFLLLSLSGVSHMCSFIWWLIWRWMAYHYLTHMSGSLLLAISSAPFLILKGTGPGFFTWQSPGCKKGRAEAAGPNITWWQFFHILGQSKSVGQPRFRCGRRDSTLDGNSSHVTLQRNVHTGMEEFVTSLNISTVFLVRMD